MNSPTRRADTADAHFLRVVAADARTVSTVRNEFGRWIRTHLAVDEERISDIVLAVNEALANAAEFAYSSASQPGAMNLLAAYDSYTSVLSVTVTDEGAWRIADSERKRASRGRGIPLMRALADRATIDSTAEGTRVRLEWNHVTAAQNAVN